MTDSVKIYIAQGIEGRDVSCVKSNLEWLLSITSVAKFTPIIPYLNILREHNCDEGARHVVERDLKALADADIFLLDMSSEAHEYVGALAELVYASLCRIPTIVYVGRSERHRRKWLQYHADFLITNDDELRCFFERAPVYEEISKSLAAYYDNRADAYDDAYESRRKHDDAATNDAWLGELQEVKKNTMKYLTGRVLDIGCGTAWWESKMVHATEIVGLDGSAGMLRVATGRLEGSEKKTSFVKHDYLDKLPFDDNAFDSCFMAFVVGILNPFKIKRVLNEISRVVKPGGRVVLFDSKLERFPTAYEMVGGDIQCRGDQKMLFYKKYYTVSSLEALVTSFHSDLHLFETNTYFVGCSYSNRKKFLFAG